jgi:hypothetical protein
MSTESSGLYHPYFTEEERRDLEAVSHDDLTGEIYLQRHLLGLVMSESPPDLDFDLLLEKNRACNTAIRSLVSLIYAELELRRSRTPEWELFLNAAHLLSAEQLGIVDDVFPAETAAAIRAENPYYRRQMEMEATFDTTEEPFLPAGEPGAGDPVSPDTA